MSTKTQQPDSPEDIGPLRRALDEVAQLARGYAERMETDMSVQECFLLLQKAAARLDDEDELWPDSSAPVDWVAFGKTLKLRRQRAHLSPKELGDLADVSDSMIRFIESAQKHPSRKLVLRLLSIPALNLRLEDVIGDTDQPGVIPTLWLAPRYDPRQLITELVERLNGSGCSLEQTTAYLDYQSAADWLTTCNSPSHLEAFSNTEALEAVAKQVAEKYGAGSIDVIALGSGDARREVQLVEYLLRHTRQYGTRDIRVFLLDISHVLLTEGHNYAAPKLGRAVKQVFALHGNFHDLAQYPLFGPGDLRSRCRVFTLLGCTLANLDNEVRFFRDTMDAAGVGDFFVADYTNAYASPDQPERIRELDPPLQQGVLPTHNAWLGGALQRYCRGARSVELSIELNTDCIVRGSYELVFVATVAMEKALRPRRFVVWRVRRYDPALFEECLSRTGWRTEMRIPYGGNDRQKLTLALMRKTS